MSKERIVLWGSGILATEIIENYGFLENFIQIVAVIDNDKNRWGKLLGEYTILEPEQIQALKFDKVVVSTDRYFNEIKEQLINFFYISPEKIEGNLYFTKIKLLFKYQKSENREIRQIVEQVSQNPLKVFNYPFAEAYNNMEVEIVYDEKVGLYYVIHQNKPVYMARHLDTEEKVAKYYRSICLEQDKASPHVYLDKDFHVEKGDVVLDIGAAEGNFSIEVIEKASKIYMVEANKEWIEALKYTFADFKDKVVITNAFISDYTACGIYQLDDLINESVNFIKMDIEGSEVDALRGAKALIGKSNNVKCAICTYHNDNDDIVIKKIAEDYSMSYKFTEGYMFFPNGIKQRYISPTLRKGIIRCWRGES